MKKKVYGIILTVVIAAGAVNVQAAEKSSGEPEALRCAVMTGNLDHYTTEIGKWQGIFEKNGVALETTEFVAGINTIDSVVNGLADIGNMADYAAVNRLGNTQNETDLKIFSELSGAGLRNGGLYVAPKYEDDLEALDGSEGFMTMTGTVNDYYTSLAIEYLGLDENKQNIINTDSAQTQLSLAQSGAASAIVASGSNATYLEQYGWKLAVGSEELGIETGAYFLAKEDFIKENPELLAKFLDGVKESYEYINDNLDESAEYLEGKIGIKAEDFKTQWESYQLATGFTEEAAVHLEKIEKWAFERGRFDEDYNIRDFIDTSIVEIAAPDKVTIKK